MTSIGTSYEEDIVARIRDLIDGYSKDSILKEYLQNADDSGATELIVTYDKRIHQFDNKDYELAKGPALLLYNNSDFNENDFKSFVKISTQGKSGDANSTGRFGQGFSSSFSISDHPGFISSDRAYWFDVLKRAVSQNKNESIQAWKKEGFSEIEEWLNTFKISDQETGKLKGTIFRLPLRNEQTYSEISNEKITGVRYALKSTTCMEFNLYLTPVIFFHGVFTPTLWEWRKKHPTLHDMWCEEYFFTSLYPIDLPREH